jgi:hypothetical protein
MGWDLNTRGDASGPSSTLSKFGKGVLIGAVLYLLMQAFLGWP